MLMPAALAIALILAPSYPWVEKTCMATSRIFSFVFKPERLFT